MTKIKLLSKILKAFYFASLRISLLTYTYYTKVCVDFRIFVFNHVVTAEPIWMKLGVDIFRDLEFYLGRLLFIRIPL